MSASLLLCVCAGLCQAAYLPTSCRKPAFVRPQYPSGTLLDYGVQVFAPPSPPKHHTSAVSIPDVPTAESSPVRRQLDFDTKAASSSRCHSFCRQLVTCRSRIKGYGSDACLSTGFAHGLLELKPSCSASCGAGRVSWQVPVHRIIKIIGNTSYILQLLPRIQQETPVVRQRVMTQSAAVQNPQPKIGCRSLVMILGTPWIRLSTLGVFQLSWLPLLAAQPVLTYHITYTVVLKWGLCTVL